MNEPIFSDQWIEQKVNKTFPRVVGQSSGESVDDKEEFAFAHSLRMCLVYISGIWLHGKGERAWKSHALLPFLIVSSPALRTHPALFERLYHCCRFMMLALETENKFEVDKSLGLVDDLCIEFAYKLGGMPEADAADRRIKGIK
jgi:hypothetical protein